MAITVLTDKIFVNDIGTVFRATIKEDGAIVDVSSAIATKQFSFQPPDGVSFIRSATFTTDGTDGQIEYATVDDDLSVGGEWKLQAFIILTAWTGHSDIIEFKVYDNLT